jgi:diguanylate cyclase (GGDEF)-like protein
MTPIRGPLARLDRSRDELAKAWLVRLIERASLDEIRELPTERLARELPELISDIVREAAEGQGDPYDLPKEQAERAASLATMRGGGGDVQAADVARDVAALQSVLVRALREEIGESDPARFAEAVEQLVEASGAIQAAAMEAHVQTRSRELESQANTDPLTGLGNLRALQRQLGILLDVHKRYRHPFGLLLMDIDGLKRINDSHGHQAGDRVLMQVAMSLRRSIRSVDTAARIGGDEFCVLLQDIADPREAAAVAQKLIHELGKSYRIDRHEVLSGASIGIACVPQDGQDVATLMRLSDAAMYRAKQAGRNGYQFFSVVLNQDAAAAAALVEDLRAGIERGELFLVYQPRIDIATRQVVGAEALLRWRHPRYGVLAPEAFLPLADDTGLLLPIGAWVLREACEQGRRWLDAGIRPFSVVVNMTARQLRNTGLGEQVRAALETSRLPPESLLIEVPETLLRQIPEQLEEGLAEVAAAGARLGVDDFGTGYASLPMLQRLHVGAVCIDRKLVAGVPVDAERAGLAKALIALARGLNFDVVAKGVETHAQREFLAEAGCRVCQGDLFAAPGPADEVEPFLRARRAA